jgi:hypothetical protein
MKKLVLLKSQYKNLIIELKFDHNKFFFHFIGPLGFSSLCYGSLFSFSVFGSKKTSCSFFSFLKQECLGVSYGFYVNMYLHGVGYRVWAYKNKLLFKIGYNHLVKFTLPNTIKVFYFKAKFLLFGVSKEELNRIANRLVLLKKPDSYKGKGFRFFNREFKLKETKDAKKK